MTMLIVHSETLTDQMNMLANKLSESVHVTLVTSYFDAAQRCNEEQPEIIIAQNHLEDGNAFDFCTRMRLLQNQQMIPIFILADKHSKKERVQTFQVGADEYISEFDIDYIVALINHELEGNRLRLQLEEEKTQASNLVAEALTTSSELGNAINFIERCHRFESRDVIATEVIKFCALFKLKVVVGIHEEAQWHFFSSTGTVAELERDLMQSIHQQDRFVDFGIRTQMNWPNIAVLIKNMPLREPDKYGRIKDLLPTLLSSANIRIHSLYEEKRIQEQTTLMTEAIQSLQPSIEHVCQSMKSDNKQHRDGLSNFLQKIIIALPTLGLEDDQEDFFISSVESLIQQAEQMGERSAEHQLTLESTNRVLLELLEKQLEIQRIMSSPLPEKIENEQTTDELFELF